MAQFHTLYNAVVLLSPDEDGPPLPAKSRPRVGKAIHSVLLGRIGETQLLPTYLGGYGIASLICGFIAIEIIGLNMLAQVDWNPLRFIKMVPFLSLEPPDPKYGLHAAAAGGRRLVADGGLLPDRLDLPVVDADVHARQAARHGHPRLLVLRLCDLALPGARLHPSP